MPFDPNQERDEQGRWTAGGGASAPTVERWTNGGSHRWMADSKDQLDLPYVPPATRISSASEQSLRETLESHGLTAVDMKDVDPRVESVMNQDMMYLDPGELSPEEREGIDQALTNLERVSPSTMAAIKASGVQVTACRITPVTTGAVTYCPPRQGVLADTPLHVFINTEFDPELVNDAMVHGESDHISTKIAESVRSDPAAWRREVIKGTVTHELGHVADYLSGNRYSAVVGMMSAVSTESEMDSFLRQVSENVSRYAAYSPHEAVAEIYAAAICGIPLTGALRDLGQMMRSGEGVRARKKKAA